MKQIQRRLGPDDVAQLVLAYQEGSSLIELATRFQIHRATVAAHLDRQGLTNRRGGLDATQVEMAAELYANGWSLAMLAGHFGVYPTSIYYRLRKAGVQLRKRQGWSY